MTTSDIHVRKDDTSVLPVRYTNDDGQEDDPILLLKLSRNQAVDVQCVARKGTGREHAKWSPVSNIAMKPIPIVKVDNEKIA